MPTALSGALPSSSGVGGAAWLQRYTGALLNVFGAPQRVLVRGSGSRVWDADGVEYLDLLGGIAVNVLGHAHPLLTSVIASQQATLGHISNFFTSPAQVALAERLLALAGAPAGSRVFFANSGTEAVEAALKLARRAGNSADPVRPTVVALEQGFHGRTMGALSLTHKAAYREPFAPLPGGVEHIPAGDLAALRAAITDRTAALVLEPIQGEAGVLPLPAGYLREARRLTREAGALLILDEVQTGVGRTGRWFAFQHEPDLLPDAVTLAKGLGGGFPIGALITFGSVVSDLLGPGQHGSTFGGNPVATAAGLATLHVIEADDLLGNAARVGARLRAGLARVPGVTAVRGQGLLIGFDLADAPDSAPDTHPDTAPSSDPATPLAPAAVTAALEAGFVLNAPGPRTLRLAPPLLLTAEEADGFLAALPGILATARAATGTGSMPTDRLRPAQEEHP
ncbi:acetylornithine transaminase [Tersicoccus phoenicis]|uniref:Acetylornithine aminotransferase n=1 Tax=Tersicoccus phoenicis TaxID=554083 RepID=A0A1R1L643_9MICC|nr:acetylornithine transaminase [Tersicoccus phoenicis]OMH23006.1 acetylornithine transaminase [Tersicoccus phoenicis]